MSAPPVSMPKVNYCQLLLQTPPFDKALPGITMQRILELAPEVQTMHNSLRPDHTPNP